MRTLLISSGKTAPPASLVDLLTRGSTSLEQRRAADLAGTQPVVIVDESTARRLWPGEDALGKVSQSRTVIGVVHDVKSAGGRR